MKQRYRKPSSIPEQFVEATRHGWIDNRTGEVLESIPNLVARLADYEKYMADLERIHEESDTDSLLTGVNSFEVHKQSKSLELQNQQETENHMDVINNVTQTTTIKEPPKTDTKVEKDSDAKPRPKNTTKSKAKVQTQAQDAPMGSNIVIK